MEKLNMFLGKQRMPWGRHQTTKVLLHTTKVLLHTIKVSKHTTKVSRYMIQVLHHTKKVTHDTEKVSCDTTNSSNKWKRGRTKRQGGRMIRHGGGPIQLAHDLIRLRAGCIGHKQKALPIGFGTICRRGSKANHNLCIILTCALSKCP